jgi:hypothetical protein
MAQKCITPEVNGVEDNIFLFLMTVYEFHASAMGGRLKAGDMRIFLFIDMAKAFDRAQWPAITQAIRQVFGLPNTRRVAAMIKDMYKKARIIISSKAFAAMTQKLGGVHQGDPLSPVLFIILLELVRRQIPHYAAAKVAFRLDPQRPFYVRIELDYADDQIRAADKVSKAQSILDNLVAALKKVGQHYNPVKSKVLALKYDPAAPGRVAVFDPKLEMEAENGIKIKVEAYTADNHLKVLGTLTNYKGDFSEAARQAADKEDQQRKRMVNTLFPLAAKVDAIKTVVACGSEYLFGNVWFLERELDTMDREERKAMRELLHINVPNAACEAQLAIAQRSKRAQATFLGRFVARLGNPDSRIALLARYLIEETGQRLGRVLEGKAQTNPPFFNWTETSQKNPERDLLKIGLRIQYLADKWGVGLKDEQGVIHVTLLGLDKKGGLNATAPLTIKDPQNLTKLLVLRARKEWLRKLMNRISTNKLKSPAPPGSVGWGLASQDAKQCAKMISYLSTASTFNDNEVRILIALFFQLWKTALRDAIFEGDKQSAKCSRCGSIETAEHILNLPRSAVGHSEALKCVPQGRHTEGVTELAKWLVGDLKPEEAIVMGEGVEKHPETQHFHRAILEKAAEGQLGETEQHFKPDLVVAIGLAGQRKVWIIDVTFATDGKLIEENELVRALLAKKAAETERHLFLSDAFDKDGRASAKGLKLVESLLGKTAAKIARNVGCFKQGRYIRRYEPIRKVIEQTEVGCTAEVLTVAIGVGAWIPKFTSANLKTIGEGRRSADIKARLRLVARIWAIKAWKAWQNERAGTG